MERLLFFLAALLGAAAHAQNLVPNGSFEDFDYCPNYWSQFGDNVVGWDVCSPSPDFFHTCRDSTDFGVPFNWRGYQQASHGRGYSGVGTYQWNAPHYREFVCAELSEALIPGAPVDLSMKVALGGFGSYWLYSPRWTTRGIGMLLTTQPFSWSTGSVYPNTAHLYMDTIFTDTLNWELLSTTYLPDSAYQYVTIGNFFEDSLSALTLLDSVFGNQNIAYVYIDEVCVSYDASACGFNSGVNESDQFQPLLFPNPVDEELHVAMPYNSKSVTFWVRDVAGRIMMKLQATSSSRDRTLDVSSLPEGVYVLRVTDGANSFAPVRFVHIVH
jgi:hypothetical protein